MSYSVLALLAILGVVLVDVRVLRTQLITRRAFWVAYAIMFGFQLIANGILAGLPIVRYDSAAILGVRLAWAPIEDLGFGFALILLSLSCWVALGRR
jgi:lycopene cyclase domain-containing protein